MGAFSSSGFYVFADSNTTSECRILRLGRLSNLNKPFYCRKRFPSCKTTESCPEDNFSVQFQTKDGAFHFFQKSELRSLDRLEASLMPTNDSERLGPVNSMISLVTWWLRVRRRARPEFPAKKKKKKKNKKEEEDTKW